MSETKKKNKDKKKDKNKEKDKKNDSYKVEKQRSFYKYIPTYTSKDSTLSGLNYSRDTIETYVITGVIGAFIFILSPIIANKFNKPLTAALITTVPVDIIMALFIEEEQFTHYLLGITIKPLVIVLLNWITYALYYYKIFPPFWCIIVNLMLWTAITLFTYVVL